MFYGKISSLLNSTQRKLFFLKGLYMIRHYTVGDKTPWISHSSLLGAKEGLQSELKQLLVLCHRINGFISVSKGENEETFHLLQRKNVYTGSSHGAADAW